MDDNYYTESLTENFNNKSWNDWFKTAWHFSMWFMMANMALMVVPTVAIAGTSISFVDPSFGVLDWIKGFAEHYYSALDKVGMLPEIISTVGENAANGEFYSGVETTHGAGTTEHTGHIGTDMVGHCTKDAFNSTIQNMNTEEFEFNKIMAERSGGDFIKQTESLCHGMQ